MNQLRADLRIIDKWIKPNSSVLDLGCGSGILLKHLKDHKAVHGYGLEINPDKITACIQKQVNVIEQDLDQALDNFASNSMDTVVMTQALQAVQRPDLLLEEMLRIGREAIVTFPNFGHWNTRLYLMFKGRMPMSEALPHNWYDTPNIHLCTFKDFEVLCREKGIRILNKTVLDSDLEEHWLASLWPSMIGETAIYHITRK